MRRVVGEGISGVWMDEYSQTLAVQRQEWDNFAEKLGRECDLVTSHRMWAHWLIMPTPHYDLEARLDSLADARSRRL